MLPTIRIKRVYDPPEREDGLRILVDRLWPRGLRRAEARVDVWLKEVAPSDELRRWFGHRPERWKAFHERYVKELEANPATEDLRRVMAEGPVTLLFSARDELRNNAVALSDFLNAAAG